MSQPASPPAPAQPVVDKPIVVQKYGGSSVADVPGIQAVARRVVETAQAGNAVVVVVSAMGNTTNELLALARSVCADPGRRELDLLVSVGERVSMTLLAMAIQDLGLPAASFTGSQSGIITDTNHVAARVEEVRPHRVQRALSDGHVAIVAGFQGVSRAGEVTTLGRGGSDTTAVVLAAALKAQWCELCSDVDGIFTADPRVVEGARRLDTLPLDAAVALSQAGAKVLHAQAVELARALGVELHAAATTRPAGTGTRLPPGPTPAEPVGVAIDHQLMHCAPEHPAQLTGCQGAVRHWRTTPHGLEAWVDTRNIAHAHTLPGATPAATVTAVGRRLVDDPTATAAVTHAAAQVAPIAAWWATADRLVMAVTPADAPRVAQAVHTACSELAL